MQASYGVYHLNLGIIILYQVKLNQGLRLILIKKHYSTWGGSLKEFTIVLPTFLSVPNKNKEVKLRLYFDQKIRHFF